MAHRGRLNVLAHTVGRAADAILREFEGERVLEAVTTDLQSGSGDVKYHLGAEAVRQTPSGDVGGDADVEPEPPGVRRPRRRGRGARLADGPQLGARAATTRTSRSPILIHGDAAFPGQGVVAETLNLAGLAGYTTGGTLHVIANNQVGYTTDPKEGRSTRYSSDLAKGFDSPIIHVNADDPEAAISAIRLAMGFRERFHHDVVVDLVGYRRFGHNEGDEPSYTQPLMYKLIDEHPSVRELYARQLVELGLVTEEEADRLLEDVQARLRAVARGAAGRPRDRRAPQGAQDRPRRRRPDRHVRPGRSPARAERPAARRAGGLHRPPEAREGARAPPRRAGRGGRHRLGAGRGARVREPPFRRDARFGSPARTPSAGPSPTATSSSTTTRPARSTRPSSTCRSRVRPSRCTTRRSPRRRRSASSTATRSRFRARSSSGRPSSATSSTPRR